MARFSRSLVLWMVWIGLAVCWPSGVCVVRAGEPGSAGSDSSLSDNPADHCSLFGRLFNRYLRTKPRLGESLRGKAQETIARYSAYAGWTIEVVLINQVDSFDEDWHQQKNLGARIFNHLADPLQCTTQDGTIRRQLLFHQGQILDPFALADSELLIRSLRFIDDVRIMVIPLTGLDRRVAVVVQSQDNWPLGADAKVFSQDRYDASLYSVNMFGRGLAWTNVLIHNGDRKPPWGYRGRVQQPNMTGHFVDLDLEYEDSWRRLRRRAALTKALAHPGVRLVGGAELMVEDDRDNNQIPRRYTAGDYWLGRALRLGTGLPGEKTSRMLLVPAFAYQQKYFSQRPVVSLTENRSFHDRKLYLAGVSLLKVRDFKTSYFYRMGETEDIRSGWLARLTLAYEDGEFQQRGGSWLQTGLVAVGRGGQVMALGLGGGGYWRAGNFEEGVLDASVILATKLYGLGAFGQRWYLRTHYTRGYDRFPEEEISLGNRTGLRGFDDDALRGQQRLVTSLESRLFTPWSVLGFRYLLLGYCDVGLIGPGDASLLQERVSLSAGFGVRLDNPGLVLPPIQLRLGVLDQNRGWSTVVELTFGKGRILDEFLFPVVKPEPVAFK